MPASHSVRALYTLVADPTGPSPLHAKVFYPSGVPGAIASELENGIVAAAADGPFPVALFFNPANVGPEPYGWLGSGLAGHGFVVVTYSRIEQVRPGVEAAMPGDPSEIIPAVIGHLASLNDRPGVLHGALDLRSIALGGHSFGATTALHGAHRSEVGAVFGYGGHDAVQARDGGHLADIRMVNEQCPVLLINGDNDGVIDRSRHRYGVTADVPWLPAQWTFERGLKDRDGLHAYVSLAGANHFSFAEPDGQTEVGRPFLEAPATTHGPTLRSWMTELIATFLRRSFGSDPGDCADLDRLLASPLVSTSLRR